MALSRPLETKHTGTPTAQPLKRSWTHGPRHHPGHQATTPRRVTLRDQAERSWRGAEGPRGPPSWRVVASPPRRALAHSRGRFVVRSGHARHPTRSHPPVLTGPATDAGVWPASPESGPSGALAGRHCGRGHQEHILPATMSWNRDVRSRPSLVSLAASLWLPRVQFVCQVYEWNAMQVQKCWLLYKI